jgi:DNA phosphorothioation-associated putative methyltransferase
MNRGALSRPVAVALDDGILVPASTFFDYGCGRGGDIQRLAALGYEAEGWDPAHRPEGLRRPADVVNFGYVANIIEDARERVDALRGAWSLARRVLIVAARLDWEARDAGAHRYGDGILTSSGTFQKFFAQDELRTWIDATLEVRSVAAAPGIYYVFRHEADAQAVLARRVRRRPTVVPRLRITEALYEANRELLAPLVTFLQGRGRAPDASELAEAATIEERFGSLRAALTLIQRAANADVWTDAQRRAREDLTVYLGLAAFGGRPKLGVLPRDLQLDIKAFFGSYKEACSAADTLLFQAGNQSAIEQACCAAPLGKLTREALYVHVSALGHLPPLLRVYEGCGRALAGTVEGTTVVKLNRAEPKVSYLVYPDFDAHAHPALAASVRADLRRLHLKYRDFRGHANPPILHRKELFVADDYPQRPVFAQLTAQEEQAGLFESPASIGTRSGWEAALHTAGLRIRDHQLLAR